MPIISLHPPSKERSASTENPLPQLLQTPSGFAIVEIQGSVNSSLSPEQRGHDGATPLGKLVFPLYDSTKPADDVSWQKRVYLYVGKHQRLTGEVKKLGKPIALVRRRITTDARAEVEELEVAEIVYYKVLFAHRPEPVGTTGS
ncbi:hypothetical protein LTR36_010660 [Oleoguttula mirabilis]|uniref:Chromosome transmission fidelity protein 8 n=1 Tax=Oleoguttula mirabilis TaxID=1507867 RepID=A0AAV9JR63_9PEZI|nr:hypothetical protein LTR36_010660 [Oleoguttula mirabilis]